MPTILHTEASLGLGGQELRIVAESRWLRDHGWGALIACQPESRLFAEARTAGVDAVALPMRNAVDLGALLALRRLMKALAVDLVHTDRKSTRLNSSHSQISYAVFCLKKKKKKNLL